MKTIEITTTQNVTIEYQLATVMDRFLTFLIDLLIVGVVYLGMIFVILRVAPSAGDSSMGGAFVLMFLPLGMFTGYHLFSEFLFDGQSLGKKALGIKVVRMDGREPTFSDYLLRAIFHLVDTILSFGIIAALLISSSGRRQRLGDLTGNTVVIKTRINERFQLEDILRINSMDNYEPSYPGVRKLTEKDVILIKSFISRYEKYRYPVYREMLDEVVEHLASTLEIANPPSDKIAFLKTLIRDYIVLTR